MDWFEQSDFWWLPEDTSRRNLLVGVGHHCPFTDDDEPCSVKWFHSVSGGRQLTCDRKMYPLHFLAQWRSLCNNTNVYRTLELYDSGTEERRILGPFLVDIDNSVPTDGYEENLSDALLVVRKVADFLSKHWSLSERDIRIFFSGRKGFNIEIRPRAVGIGGPVASQLKSSGDRLEEIINHFGTGSNTLTSKGTVIDRIYGRPPGRYKLRPPDIRLHSSWNEWRSQEGTLKGRKRIELTHQELVTWTVDEICTRAERSE